MIEFNTHPVKYQHLTIDYDCPIATLKLKVNERWRAAFRIQIRVGPAERALRNNHGARLKILEDLYSEFVSPSKHF